MGQKEKQRAINNARRSLRILESYVVLGDQYNQQKYLRELLLNLDPLRIEVFGGSGG